MPTQKKTTNDVVVSIYNLGLLTSIICILCLPVQVPSPQVHDCTFCTGWWFFVWDQLPRWLSLHTAYLWTLWSSDWQKATDWRIFWPCYDCCSWGWNQYQPCLNSCWGHFLLKILSKLSFAPKVFPSAPVDSRSCSAFSQKNFLLRSTSQLIDKCRQQRKTYTGFFIRCFLRNNNREVKVELFFQLIWIQHFAQFFPIDLIWIFKQTYTVSRNWKNIWILEPK